MRILYNDCDGGHTALTILLVWYVNCISIKLFLFFLKNLLERNRYGDSKSDRSGVTKV